MNRENKWLIVVVVALAVAAFITGGAAIYLITARKDGQAADITEAEIETENEQAVTVAEDMTDELQTAIEDAQASTIANAVSTDEPRLAFVSDQEGGTAVYVMDADGSDKQKISEPSLRFCLYPTWSPDGQRVAYWGTEESTFTAERAVAGVWVSAADGAEHVRVNHDITNVPIIPPPVWSPDGSRLVFAAANDSGEPGSTIHIVRADGSGIERSIPLPWKIQHLVWSPVGDDLLFVSKTSNAGDGNVYVWSSATERIIEIFQGAEAADWSPDGQEIVVGDMAGQEVLAVRLNGESPPVIPVATGSPIAIACSPDGMRVAIGIGPANRRGLSFPLYPPTSLYVVTLESGAAAAVTENQGRIHYMNWSRDGSRLLFTLVNMGRRPGSEVPWANLWSYDVASGGLEQLTNEEGFAGLGAWSH